MKFSRNEEEELRKLKQKVQQQDARFSMLQVEKQKEESQRATVSKELNDVRQRFHAEESKFVQLEDEFVKVKEDRDRQRLANTNLQQALNTAQSQLQDREKDKRLFSADTDREHHRLLRASEDEVEKLTVKCKQLEQQLRSQVTSLQGPESRNGGGGHGLSSISSGLDAKVAFLEDENAALKASLIRYEKSIPSAASPSVSGGRSRRPRSSSVSGGSSTEAYQLTESLNESNARAERLEARATKAEREALKASNELIAASRRSDGIVKDLESKLADVSYELDFQRDHVVKKLEKDVEELQVQCSRAEKELSSVQAECSSLRSQLESSAETISTQSRIADVSSARITALSEERSVLEIKLVAADACAKRLEQREKEVESARKRIRKLSHNLRRILGGLASGTTTTGDETSLSVLGAGPDESAVFNTTAMTSQRDYSTDMLDELEQLLCYVDEADGRAEFAKVESRIQAQTAVVERDELTKQIGIASSEMQLLKEASDRERQELQEQQLLIDTLQAAKGHLEEAIQARRTENDLILAEKQEALTSLSTLQVELGVMRVEIERSDDEQSELMEKTVALEKVCSQREEQLEELEIRLHNIFLEKGALESQVEEAQSKIRSLEEQSRKEQNHSEELLSHKQSLEEEKQAGEAQLSLAEAQIVKHKESQRVAELEGAMLAMDVHRLQEQLCDAQALGAEKEIRLMTQGLHDLRFEHQQWKSLVEDLKLEISTNALQQAKKEEEMAKADQERSNRMELLQAEVDKTGSTLAERVSEVQRLRLDLQASRANQQLAEDALSKLLPNTRETDLTVLGDASSMDATQNNSTEAEDSLQAWRDRVKNSEEMVESARVEAQHFRDESKRLELELKRFTGLISKHSEEVDALNGRIQQAEEASTIAQLSMETMQDELNARIPSMQKMQMTLQTSEGAILDLQKENVILEEKMAEAEKIQLVTSESISARDSLVGVLTNELRDSHRESSVLKTEMDALVYGLSALRDDLKEAQAAREDLEARAKETERLYAASLQALEATDREVEQQEIAQSSRYETERNLLSEQVASLTEELQEAREAFDSLKEQMEVRNAEYWETKEELAEWQERYERSQADVKVKDELDERLREAHAELDVTQARAEAMHAKCVTLEQDLVRMKGEREEMLSRMSAQDTEMQLSNQLVDDLAEAQLRLADTEAHIERLEFDLAQKAQECEDADDKELALRKDNKRLAARLATLQARVEKLQQSAASSHVVGTLTQTAVVVNTVPETMTGQVTSVSMRPSADGDASTGSGSRKRRTPDDEETARQTESEKGPTLTRAVYAPKPTAVHAARSNVAPVNAGTGMTTSNSGSNVRKVSQSPSDLIAKRLRSPKKESLQDRTNLLQPRLASQNGQAAAQGGNPFMAKLNRYRAPALPVQPSQ